MKKKIHVRETYGLERHNEPITVGYPFAQGEVFDCDRLSMTGPDGNQVSIQANSLSLWHDGSTKWALIDFQASIQKNSVGTYRISTLSDGVKNENHDQVMVNETKETLEVETGNAVFYLDKKRFRPFSKVVVDGETVVGDTLSHTVLTDSEGNCYEPEIENVSIERSGGLHTIIKLDGYFDKEKKPYAMWMAQLHFYAGKSVVRAEFTIWNPKPAKHPGGLWDLGDPGSILFKDLSLILINETDNSPKIKYRLTPEGDLRNVLGNSLSIYQGSSGGENWQSPNHLNRNGEIPVSFKGYRIKQDKEGDIQREGRANPVVCLGTGPNSISVAVDKFWQNFPKSIEVDDNKLNIRLFPQDYDDLYELQGGERKTHTIFLDFGRYAENLNWAHIPLCPVIPREFYAHSGAIPYLSKNNYTEDAQYDRLLSCMLEGESSFFSKREIIDEYGWRNFGEVYADHESIGNTGNRPRISHYNNQYDQVYGFFRQYIATENSGWFELMKDLAAHVYDIDIYHTNGDRKEYNLALHWHTNHYLDAGTSTHRSLSKAHLSKYDAMFYGGGPSLEHCYASGLMYHYFVTGDTRSRQAVTCIADWVCNTIERQGTFLGMIFDIKKKMPEWKKVFLGSKIRADKFPFTRGSGNAISALLDAYSVTSEHKYLENTEEIIRGCIHPNDDIESRSLLNAEICWSYNVLLQSIGKYLDTKIELKQIDKMYAYAQRSLLHYASWMLKNEYPYLDKESELEYPNETWPAQDLRKSCVLFFAAKHATGELSKKYFDKALYFNKYAIKKLNEFDTKLLARPAALLMQNRWMYSYFAENPGKHNKNHDQAFDLSQHNEYWTRYQIIKNIITDFFITLKKFSFKKEYHWFKCRKYKHI